MLAEELLVLNGEGVLWQQARPLLDAALRLERSDEGYIWHGWSRDQVCRFLKTLPSPCSLLVGVWDTIFDEQGERDTLVLGIVCEVVQGTVASICTFEKLVAAGLKPLVELEIGLEDALDIMHYARREVAPVAWALFIERTAWDEWLFSSAEDGGALDKGALLDTFARKGRCVLMGSQAALNEK